MCASYEIILCDEEVNSFDKRLPSSVESAFSAAESYEDFWEEGEGWTVRGFDPSVSIKWVELGSKWWVK